MLIIAEHRTGGPGVLMFCPVLSCRTGSIFGFCPVLPPARTKVGSRTGQDRTKNPVLYSPLVRTKHSTLTIHQPITNPHTHLLHRPIDIYSANSTRKRGVERTKTVSKAKNNRQYRLYHVLNNPNRTMTRLSIFFILWFTYLCFVISLFGSFLDILIKHSCFTHFLLGPFLCTLCSHTLSLSFVYIIVQLVYPIGWVDAKFNLCS